MRFFAALLLSLFSLSTIAQSAEELRSRVKKLEAEITQINRMITENNKQKNSAGKNQKLISKKISNRRQIIEDLDQQIAITRNQLGEEGAVALRLAAQANNLKEKHSELIKVAYYNYKINNFSTYLGSQSQFMHSSRNLTKAIYISDALRDRLHGIDTATVFIQGQIELLGEEQQRLAQLFSSKEGELKLLERESKQLAGVNSKLTVRGSELTRRVSDNRAKLQALQKEIAAVVARENRKRKEQAPEPRRDASETKLSSVFEKNVGKFLSPVAGGVIVDRFGEHNHPTQAGIKVSNNGINIACKSGSAVKVIFEGEVRAVFPTASMGISVLVRHGSFLSVYSGLKGVTVKMGESVAAGQSIGVVADDQLHFEIWRETQVLDPERWLNL